MGKRKINQKAPYQSISQAAFLSGMSTGWIRKQCKEGKIQHIMVGNEYRINMPALFEFLDDRSRAASEK